MPKFTRNEIPQHIRSIEPYLPGKPVEEVERQLGVAAVKLASNENPLGPSQRAIEAAKKSMGDSNRYPDGGSFYLREALSERLNLPPDTIILGSGSTDLIHLAAAALLAPGTSAVISQGSFPLYRIAANKMGAKLIAVPLKDYAFDLDAISSAIEPQTKLIYIANPNNPTGTVFDANRFAKFFARVPEHVLVVLDEAYFEYVSIPEYSRSLDLARARSNLFVLRTFSKVYGLAGLRIGYGIGSAELIHEMDKIRLPFPVSGVAQAAALAALDDAEHVRNSLESNRRGLRQLEDGLGDLGVRFIPSVGNFMLVEAGQNGDALAEELLRLGVIVRPMAWMGFPEAIRVSVGTQGENRKFLDALARLRAAGTQTMGDQENRGA